MAISESDALIIFEKYLPLLIGAILSILGFIWVIIKIAVKRKVELHFEKEFANYQKSLEQKTEILKTELGIYAHEQNVSISRFDSQRATAVENVYLALIEVIEKFSAAVAIPGHALFEDNQNFQEFYEEHVRELLAVTDNYTKIIFRNAIYFDEQLHNELKKSTEIIKRALYLFGGVSEVIEENKPPALTPNMVNYDKVREEFFLTSKNEIIELKTILTKKFREVLNSKETT